jgi:3-oxoadipate enol-lactonase
MNFPEELVKVHTHQLSVSYIDQGPKDAPVIIFIHGFPLNKSMWNEQIESFSKQYRVIAYDVRGHGQTEIGNVDLSIELFVSDLLSLMDTLEIQTGILCGLSMGGYIALNAIKNFPHRIDGLILCDTTCIADTPETKEKRKESIHKVNEFGVVQYAEEIAQNLLAPETFTTKPQVIASVKEMILHTSQDSITETILALAGREESCSYLPEILVPVLILVGKEDKITPPASAQQIHDCIKNSKLFIIENAGHLSNLENPEIFNTHLNQFIQLVYQKN